jgi:hypothetical protein
MLASPSEFDALVGFEDHGQDRSLFNHRMRNAGPVRHQQALCSAPAAMLGLSTTPTRTTSNLLMRVSN